MEEANFNAEEKRFVSGRSETFDISNSKISIWKKLFSA